MAVVKFRFGEFIRFYLRERGLDVREAAARMGVAESTLHRWMKQPAPAIRSSLQAKLADVLQIDRRRIFSLLSQAKRGVPLSAIDDVAGRDAGGLPFDDFSPVRDSPEAGLVMLRRIPYFDLPVPAGGWSEATEGRSAEQADGWVPVPADAPPDAFAFRIRGDSMEPRFPDKTILICAPVAPGGTKFVGGKPYYVVNSDGRATFKLVFFEPGRERYRLEAINPRYKPMYVPETALARLSRAVHMLAEIE